MFHVSDDPAITLFEPRPSPYTERPVVWAVSAERLANYLLPRQCPRVCFWAMPGTTPKDKTVHLGGDRAVIAIEADWLERAQSTRLYCYRLPTETFTILDANAGYWVSQSDVTPLSQTARDDLPTAIATEKTALRVLPSLWGLHDAIAASSLGFSMIRMRNAAARPG